MIREAFLELMSEKHYTKITVKEVADRADINRTTFYNHYEDIYDLVNRMESDILDDIKKKVSQINAINYKPGEHPQHIALFSILKKHTDEFIALLDPNNGDIELLYKMAGTIQKELYNGMKSTYRVKEPEGTEMYCWYLAWGITGTFIMQLSDLDEKTAEEMGLFTGEISNWIFNAFLKNKPPWEK